MEQHQLAVSNVKCEGCAKNISQGLGTLEGVAEVSVDVGAGSVAFAAEASTLPAVRQKLAELGYPEREAPGVGARLRQWLGS